MYFDTKNYLKNIHSHTDKHALSFFFFFLYIYIILILIINQDKGAETKPNDIEARKWLLRLVSPPQKYRWSFTPRTVKSC
jgi:hypothetical protein